MGEHPQRLTPANAGREDIEGKGRALSGFPQRLTPAYTVREEVVGKEVYKRKHVRFLIFQPVRFEREEIFKMTCKK